MHLSGAPDAPALVALHGALGTAAQLSPLLDVWSRRFRVVAPDLPGHGRSARLRGMPTWADYAGAVEVVLDQLAGGRAHLFGYSLGAGVALAVAHRRPEAVDHLVLHATNVQWTAVEVDRMTAEVEAATARPDGARRLEALHGDRWRESVEAMLAFSRGLPEAWLSDEALSTITAPALVTIGDADALFAPEAAAHLARTLPNARLRVFPGVAHPLSTLDATAFADAVADHLGAP